MRWTKGLGTADWQPGDAAWEPATCQANLAEGNGKPGRVAGPFAAAGDVWAALPRPYPAARARERRGYCLSGAGQRDAGAADR